MYTFIPALQVLWGLPNHEAGKFRRVDAYAQILPGSATAGSTEPQSERWGEQTVDDLLQQTVENSQASGNLNLKIVCKQYAKSIYRS